MAEKYEIEINGFELEVEIYSDYESLDFSIENMFDITNNFEELENDIYEMILEDMEDDIKELIMIQILAERDRY